MNAWLPDYAQREGPHYLDCHTALAAENGKIKPEYSIGGVHSDRDGYALMRKLAASLR